MEQSFKRHEKKFLLTEEQYGKLIPRIDENMKTDEYGEYTICNIYYDTDDYSLIRRSVEKPVYKEKFRLRCYGVPDGSSMVFAEIKKKYEGIVYKRRVSGQPGEIRDFLAGTRPLPEEESRQIQREIRCFMDRYHPHPAVFIAYERTAYAGKKDSLRVTFDRNIRWRDSRLDLMAGDKGNPVLPDGGIIMEVKIETAIPLWLAGALTDAGIFPTSFSKYGTCYQRYILPRHFQKERCTS